MVMMMYIIIVINIIIIMMVNNWSGYIGKSYRRSIPTISRNGSHNSPTCHKIGFIIITIIIIFIVVAVITTSIIFILNIITKNLFIWRKL